MLPGIQPCATGFVAISISNFGTVGGQKLARIKFVVIWPNLKARFDHVLQYLIPSAYNMLIKPTSATFIPNFVLWSQFLHIKKYFY